MPGIFLARNAPPAHRILGMATNQTLSERLEMIRKAIRDLDIQVSKLKEASLVRDDLEDARDHLQQIHFRLTECKGHVGAISYNLKKKPDDVL